MSDLSIRSARPKDLPAIARFAAELVRFHHAIDPDRFLCVDGLEKGYERYLSGELRSEGVVLLAAEENEKLCGYVYARIEPRNWNDLLESCGKIHDIYVDPSVRRSGVGRRLLERAIHDLEALGAPRVVLLTAAQNESAQRLFGSFGFRTTMLEMTREAGKPPQKME